MAAITSPKTPSLLKQLTAQYPQFAFLPGEAFYWRPEEKTVYFDLSKLATLEGKYDLLHELAHAVLAHHSYSRDIELLQLEAEAWEECSVLGHRFKVEISEEYIQNALNSYRHWLTRRSTCPKCASTGIQKTTRTYQCFNCQCVWRVNEAKFCALRRYQLTS